MRSLKGNSSRIRGIVSAAVIFGVLSSVCFGYSGGSGGPYDPYQIGDVNDLLELASTTEDYNKCFIMTADINMAEQVFTTAVIAPDTNNTNWSFDGTSFTGTFDGGNFKIIALTIDTNENSYLGLFGNIGLGSHITNLILEDANIISGDYYLGGLCGQNQGTISDCLIMASVDGDYYLGGICGYNDGGTISNCTVTGLITGNADMGGLCGNNDYGTISNCKVSGGVNSFGYYSGDVGGLCGWNICGTISNCITTCTLIDSGYGVGWLGGLCGDNTEGTISNCKANNSVTGGEGSFSIGGVCGENDDGTINNCTATGSVSGGVGSEDIGGVCGYNRSYGEINNCYATNSIDSQNDSSDIGGLCGLNDGAVMNCYAIGTVAAGDNSNYLGSLVGYDRYHNYTNSFWDISVNPTLNGIGNTSDPNVIGKTTEEMKQQATFTGWDFVEIWDIGENQTYPFLRTYLPSDINKDGETNFYDLAIQAKHWLEEY